MESFAEALNYGIPLFTILILIEYFYGYFTNKQTQNWPDTVSSLSSGVTNITKSVLGLSIAIISYSFVYDNFAQFHYAKDAWWMYVLVFVAKDFAGYWIHRFEHMVNYFWNRHVIHHSSEEYNLPCALRQSISEIFGFSMFILFPLAILGIPVKVFSIVAAIQLFAQFWYHTKHIGKMGFLEKIIVTPSHHRVHHAINAEYLDKNFSQIFIIWDKIFGTFQEEKEDIPPVYGIKRQANTWNPIIINFQHAWLIWLDFFRTKSWKDKFLIWFMPTGYRPKDVAEKYPVEVVDDPYNLEKYAPPIKNWVVIWSVVQLVVVIVIAMYMFNHLAYFGFTVDLLIGFYIFAAVFSYTNIMDGKKWAAYLEIAVSIIAITGVFYLSQNFDVYMPLMWFLVLYKALCIVLSLVFFADKNKELSLAV